MRKGVLVAALATLGWGAGGQAELPDRPSFLQQVRGRLETDAQRQYGYSFIESRQEAKLDASGRVTDLSSTLIESRPGFPGEPRWERVLAKDGKAVSVDELQRREEKHEREIDDYRKSLARQTDADREKQEREWERRRREMSDALDDVFRMYDIRMLRREMVRGHRTIAFSLTPLSDVEPVSDQGRWFPHFQGRAWIDEADHELVRLDVRAVDDVSLGMGLVARVHEGTRAVFDRERLADGAWLPMRSSLTMSARVLLLKRVRQRSTSEYTGYRKAPSAGGSSR